MKYCIGCVHLQFGDKEVSCGSSWTGSWTSEEASISCGRGHWKHYLEESGHLGFDFEKAMEHAEGCPDFQERPSPSTSE